MAHFVIIDSSVAGEAITKGMCHLGHQHAFKTKILQTMLKVYSIEFMFNAFTYV